MKTWKIQVTKLCSLVLVEGLAFVTRPLQLSNRADCTFGGNSKSNGKTEKKREKGRFENVLLSNRIRSLCRSRIS